MLPVLTEGGSAFGSVIDKVCLVGAGDEKHLRLNEAIAPREGQPLDAAAVRDDLELLFTEGELKDVVVIAQPLDPKRVVLSYFVTEYSELTDVKVEGLSAIKPDEVRDIVHAGLRASPQLVKRTVATLKELYAEAGYPRASVDGALQGMVLRLTVSEGPHAVVRTVTFEGAKKLGEAKVKNALRLVKGSTFKEDLTQVDALTITTTYLDSGFVDARVEAASTMDASGAVDVIWKVTEGDAFRVGTLSFKGLTFGTEKTVLKSFETKTKAVFSRAMLKRDIGRIEDLARRAGTPVEVTPITSINREKHTIDVQLELEPKK
ncbi:MAG: POTRA domain-containing protein [Myxococcales bacterium]|nr:POTRA domain-containing protein [Myxococcales bacterium]